MEYNYTLFLEALAKRNIHLEQIANSEYFKASYEKHVEYISEISNRLLPSHLFEILNNKYIAKKIVSQEGFPTPKGQVFYPDELNKAQKFSESINYPIVAKATNFSKGNYVHPNIQSKIELNEIWETCLLQKHPYFAFLPDEILIEESFTNWTDYRFMFIKNFNTTILKRLPAQITGDGYSSLRELIKRENYIRMNPRKSCSGEIYLEDPDGMRRLKHLNLNLETIIPKNKSLPLRYNSNESYGGTCEIISNQIHPSYLEIAESIFNIFQELSYLAVDLLIQNPLTPANQSNYTFLEFATYPGYSLFLKPTKGKPVDIIEPIIDLLFPETKKN